MRHTAVQGGQLTEAPSGLPWGLEGELRWIDRTRSGVRTNELRLQSHTSKWTHLGNQASFEAESLVACSLIGVGGVHSTSNFPLSSQLSFMPAVLTPFDRGLQTLRLRSNFVLHWVCGSWTIVWTFWLVSIPQALSLCPPFFTHMAECYCTLGEQFATPKYTFGILIILKWLVLRNKTRNLWCPP